MGKSGGGKSTLCDLLAGFYKPSLGSIMLAGYDILTFSNNELRQMIAYLPQENGIFNGTVISNMWVQDKEKAVEFLSDLGLKPYTQSMNLSGGELRRAALCRVLLRNCPVYILDEPLVGLDAKTKKVVLDLIAKTTKGKTVIIVSHEPIDFADYTHIL